MDSWLHVHAYLVLRPGRTETTFSQSAYGGQQIHQQRIIDRLDKYGYLDIRLRRQANIQPASSSLEPMARPILPFKGGAAHLGLGTHPAAKPGLGCAGS